MKKHYVSTAMLLSLSLPLSVNATIRRLPSNTDRRDAETDISDLGSNSEANTSNLESNSEANTSNLESNSEANTSELGSYSETNTNESKSNSKTSASNLESNFGNVLSKHIGKTLEFSGDVWNSLLPALAPEFFPLDGFGKVGTMNGSNSKCYFLMDLSNILPKIPSLRFISRVIVSDGPETAYSLEKIFQEQLFKNPLGLLSKDVFSMWYESVPDDLRKLNIVFVWTDDQESHACLRILKSASGKIPQGKLDELTRHLYKLLMAQVFCVHTDDPELIKQTQAETLKFLILNNHIPWIALMALEDEFSALDDGSSTADLSVETNDKKVEPKEAEQKEAEQKEAEQKEAEQKEAEQKEAERKEAERKEAAQRFQDDLERCMNREDIAEEVWNVLEQDCGFCDFVKMVLPNKENTNDAVAGNQLNSSDAKTYFLSTTDIEQQKKLILIDGDNTNFVFMDEYGDLCRGCFSLNSIFSQAISMFFPRILGKVSRRVLLDWFTSIPEDLKQLEIISLCMTSDYNHFHFRILKDVYDQLDKNESKKTDEPQQSEETPKAKAKKTDETQRSEETPKAKADRLIPYLYKLFLAQVFCANCREKYDEDMKEFIIDQQVRTLKFLIPNKMIPDLFPIYEESHYKAKLSFEELEVSDLSELYGFDVLLYNADENTAKNSSEVESSKDQNKSQVAITKDGSEVEISDDLKINSQVAFLTILAMAASSWDDENRNTYIDAERFNDLKGIENREQMISSALEWIIKTPDDNLLIKSILITDNDIGNDYSSYSALSKAAEHFDTAVGRILAKSDPYNINDPENGLYANRYVAKYLLLRICEYADKINEYLRNKQEIIHVDKEAPNLVAATSICGGIFQGLHHCDAGQEEAVSAALSIMVEDLTEVDLSKFGLNQLVKLAATLASNDVFNKVFSFSETIAKRAGKSLSEKAMYRAGVNQALGGLFGVTYQTGIGGSEMNIGILWEMIHENTNGEIQESSIASTDFVDIVRNVMRDGMHLYLIDSILKNAYLANMIVRRYEEEDAKNRTGMMIRFNLSDEKNKKSIMQDILFDKLYLIKDEDCIHKIENHSEAFKKFKSCTGYKKIQAADRMFALTEFDQVNVEGQAENDILYISAEKVPALLEIIKQNKANEVRRICWKLIGICSSNKVKQRIIADWYVNQSDSISNDDARYFIPYASNMANLVMKMPIVKQCLHLDNKFFGLFKGWCKGDIKKQQEIANCLVGELIKKESATVSSDFIVSNIFLISEELIMSGFTNLMSPDQLNGKFLVGIAKNSDRHRKRVQIIISHLVNKIAPTTKISDIPTFIQSFYPYILENDVHKLIKQALIDELSEECFQAIIDAYCGEDDNKVKKIAKLLVDKCEEGKVRVMPNFITSVAPYVTYDDVCGLIKLAKFEVLSEKYLKALLVKSHKNGEKQAVIKLLIEKAGEAQVAPDFITSAAPYVTYDVVCNLIKRAKFKVLDEEYFNALIELYDDDGKEAVTKLLIEKAGEAQVEPNFITSAAPYVTCDVVCNLIKLAKIKVLDEEYFNALIEYNEEEEEDIEYLEEEEEEYLEEAYDKKSKIAKSLAAKCKTDEIRVKPDFVTRIVPYVSLDEMHDLIEKMDTSKLYKQHFENLTKYCKNDEKRLGIANLLLKKFKNRKQNVSLDFIAMVIPLYQDNEMSFVLEFVQSENDYVKLAEMLKNNRAKQEKVAEHFVDQSESINLELAKGIIPFLSKGKISSLVGKTNIVLLDKDCFCNLINCCRDDDRKFETANCLLKKFGNRKQNVSLDFIAMVIPLYQDNEMSFVLEFVQSGNDYIKLAKTLGNDRSKQEKVAEYFVNQSENINLELAKGIIPFIPKSKTSDLINKIKSEEKLDRSCFDDFTDWCADNARKLEIVNLLLNMVNKKKIELQYDFVASAIPSLISENEIPAILGYLLNTQDYISVICEISAKHKDKYTTKQRKIAECFVDQSENTDVDNAKEAFPFLPENKVPVLINKITIQELTSGCFEKLTSRIDENDNEKREIIARSLLKKFENNKKDVRINFIESIIPFFVGEELQNIILNFMEGSEDDDSLQLDENTNEENVIKRTNDFVNKCGLISLETTKRILPLVSQETIPDLIRKTNCPYLSKKLTNSLIRAYLNNDNERYIDASIFINALADKCTDPEVSTSIPFIKLYVNANEEPRKDVLLNLINIVNIPRGLNSSFLFLYKLDAWNKIVDVLLGRCENEGIDIEMSFATEVIHVMSNAQIDKMLNLMQMIGNFDAVDQFPSANKNIAKKKFTNWMIDKYHENGDYIAKDQAMKICKFVSKDNVSNFIDCLNIPDEELDDYCFELIGGDSEDNVSNFIDCLNILDEDLDDYCFELIGKDSESVIANWLIDHYKEKDIKVKYDFAKNILGAISYTKVYNLLSIIDFEESGTTKEELCYEFIKSCYGEEAKQKNIVYWLIDSCDGQKTLEVSLVGSIIWRIPSYEVPSLLKVTKLDKLTEDHFIFVIRSDKNNKSKIANLLLSEYPGAESDEKYIPLSLAQLLAEYISKDAMINFLEHTDIGSSEKHVINAFNALIGGCTEDCRKTVTDWFIKEGKEKNLGFGFAECIIRHGEDVDLTELLDQTEAGDLNELWTSYSTLDQATRGRLEGEIVRLCLSLLNGVKDNSAKTNIANWFFKKYGNRKNIPLDFTRIVIPYVNRVSYLLDQTDMGRLEVLWTSYSTLGENEATQLDVEAIELCMNLLSQGKNNSNSGYIANWFFEKYGKRKNIPFEFTALVIPYVNTFNLLNQTDMEDVQRLWTSYSTLDENEATQLDAEAVWLCMDLLSNVGDKYKKGAIIDWFFQKYGDRQDIPFEFTELAIPYISRESSILDRTSVVDLSENLSEMVKGFILKKKLDLLNNTLVNTMIASDRVKEVGISYDLAKSIFDAIYEWNKDKMIPGLLGIIAKDQVGLFCNYVLFLTQNLKNIYDSYRCPKLQTNRMLKLTEGISHRQDIVFSLDNVRMVYPNILELRSNRATDEMVSVADEMVSVILDHTEINGVNTFDGLFTIIAGVSPQIDRGLPEKLAPLYYFTVNNASKLKLGISQAIFYNVRYYKSEESVDVAKRQMKGVLECIHDINEIVENSEFRWLDKVDLEVLLEFLTELELPCLSVQSAAKLISSLPVLKQYEYSRPAWEELVRKRARLIFHILDLTMRMEGNDERDIKESQKIPARKSLVKDWLDNIPWLDIQPAANATGGANPAEQPAANVTEGANPAEQLATESEDEFEDEFEYKDENTLIDEFLKKLKNIEKI